MKSCELCGDPSTKSVCGCCVSRMRNGEHPVVCLACRITYGALHGTEWISRSLLAAEMQESANYMETEFSGIATFVRPDCPDCRKEKPLPALTGMQESSC